MMLKIICIPLLSLFFLMAALPTSSNAQYKGVCNGTRANMACLKDNLHETYRHDYRLAFDVFYKEYDRLDSTKDPTLLTFFMDMSRIVGSNAEFSEAYSEHLEMFCPKNTKLCLDVLTSFDTETQDWIMYHLCATSTDPPNENSLAFGKYKNNPKYKDILSRYFSNEHNCGYITKYIN